MSTHQTPTPKAASATLSETFGLPKGSFGAFLKAKKEALQRVEQAEDKHVREVRDCKLTWAQ